jgi:hypothetical protein
MQLASSSTNPTERAARCSRCRGSGDIRWSAAVQASLCRRCYGKLPSAQFIPSATAPAKPRQAKRPEPPSYTQFVYRVWDQLKGRTGRAPIYLDSTHIASYCPSCLDGTLVVGFVSHPRPRAFVSSQGAGAGYCSRGCTEEQIVEALG